MQIAAEIRRVLSKNPRQIKLNDFELSFNTRTPLPDTEAKRRATEQSKAKWIKALGGKQAIRIRYSDGR